MSGASIPLRFTLDRRPLGPAEHPVFAADLDRIGHDERVLHVLDGLLTTGTRDDTPHLLRGYRGERLVFAAHPIVCRRTMRTFFPNRLGLAMDALPMPIVNWTRHDPGVDLCGSPGFVADGESREPLVEAAVRYLECRFAGVALVEEESSPRYGQPVEFGMADTGRHVVGDGAVDQLFARRTHLRRKVSKFRNKGGTVDIVHGVLAADDRAGVLRCIRCAEAAGLLHIPYQSNYVPMVDWATGARLPGLLHIVARLDGAFVGYHAFVESGRHLVCLSGGFDRTRHTTYHAYENVLLEAMRYAASRGLARVHFGPVTNPSKAALMTDAGRLAVRFYTRWTAIHRMMAFIVPRSAMRAEVLAPYRGLADSAHPPAVA